MKIVVLATGDDQLVSDAAHLFDHPPDPSATSRFLASPGHHLLVAYEDGDPAGFVSGVEMTHPDKGTEMFVYELGVDERHQRQGIGRALLEGLAEVARQRGCYGMWTLTEGANAGAVATYRAAGADEETAHVMLAWTF